MCGLTVALMAGPELTGWGAVVAILTPLITAAGGWAVAKRQAQATERPVERDLQQIAREMIESAVKGLRDDMKALKDEHNKEVKRLEKDRQRDNRNIKKLSEKWAELHGGIYKLRAAFEANDIHLTTFLNLIKTNPAQASKYLKNLIDDRKRLESILIELCEVSEPVLDAGDEPDEVAENGG